MQLWSNCKYSILCHWTLYKIWNILQGINPCDKIYIKNKCNCASNYTNSLLKKVALHDGRACYKMRKFSFIIFSCLRWKQSYNSVQLLDSHYINKWRGWENDYRNISHGKKHLTFLQKCIVSNNRKLILCALFFISEIGRILSAYEKNVHYCFIPNNRSFNARYPEQTPKFIARYSIRSPSC